MIRGEVEKEPKISVKALWARFEQQFGPPKNDPEKGDLLLLNSPS